MRMVNFYSSAPSLPASFLQATVTVSSGAHALHQRDCAPGSGQRGGGAHTLVTDWVVGLQQA